MSNLNGCAEYLPTIILFILISCITNSIGYKKKFYTLPLVSENPQINLLQMLGCFGIYFIILLPISQLIFSLSHFLFPFSEKLSIFAITQLMGVFLCFFFFGYFPVFFKKMLYAFFAKTPSFIQNPL